MTSNSLKSDELFEKKTSLSLNQKLNYVSEILCTFSQENISINNHFFIRKTLPNFFLTRNRFGTKFFNTIFNTKLEINVILICIKKIGLSFSY